MELLGGNMNRPLLKGNTVSKRANESSPTIHALICHIRDKGIDFVPESLGIDRDQNHILSYIPGIVPHETPEWIWRDSILVEIGRALRLLHDATADFECIGQKWQLETDQPHEVICHNDFAPYNCVFNDQHFSGLIDFDMCSPGSRIWDIAYTAYRFTPLMPDDRDIEYYEYSPFTKEIMFKRLDILLNAYAQGEGRFLYIKKDVLEAAQERLLFLSQWTTRYAEESQNLEMKGHAAMYASHAKWIGDQK